MIAPFQQNLNKRRKLDRREQMTSNKRKNGLKNFWIHHILVNEASLSRQFFLIFLGIVFQLKVTRHVQWRQGFDHENECLRNHSRWAFLAKLYMHSFPKWYRPQQQPRFCMNIKNIDHYMHLHSFISQDKHHISILYQRDPLLMETTASFLRSGFQGKKSSI